MFEILDSIFDPFPFGDAKSDLSGDKLKFNLYAPLGLIVFANESLLFYFSKLRASIYNSLTKGSPEDKVFAANCSISFFVSGLISALRAAPGSVFEISEGSTGS